MSAKEILLEVAEKLPSDATISDAIYELELRQAVQQGLDELDRGEGVPIEEVAGAVKEDAATSCMDSGDHLLGYLLDRAGSFAVESLAENTEKRLRCSLAPEGLGVSMRFSPGYRDWAIEEQFKLAKIVDFKKAGVTLSENCMMVPKKSISAIVGVGPKKLFSKVISPCAVCNMKVCDYRRSEE